jgi:hypothetical protein
MKRGAKRNLLFWLYRIVRNKSRQRGAYWWRALKAALWSRLCVRGRNA